MQSKSRQRSQSREESKTRRNDRSKSPLERPLDDIAEDEEDLREKQIQSRANRLKSEDLRKNGLFVWVLGKNNKGELSTKGGPEVSLPQEVRGLKDGLVRHIDSGANHSAIVK